MREWRKKIWEYPSQEWDPFDILREAVRIGLSFSITCGLLDYILGLSRD